MNLPHFEDPCQPIGSGSFSKNGNIYPNVIHVKSCGIRRRLPVGKSAEFGEAEILEKHVGEDVAATEVSRLNKVVVALFFSTYLPDR